ncbi:hypothetical protein EDB89DRAFT_1910950 [Lactarius sanguifluus]|nr:hypothetical protein EDB89DRAFT_1910950 [Lactarius sanguifluus]
MAATTNPSPQHPTRHMRPQLPTHQHDATTQLARPHNRQPTATHPDPARKATNPVTVTPQHSARDYNPPPSTHHHTSARCPTPQLPTHRHTPARRPTPQPPTHCHGAAHNAQDSVTANPRYIATAHTPPLHHTATAASYSSTIIFGVTVTRWHHQVPGGTTPVKQPVQILMQAPMPMKHGMSDADHTDSTSVGESHILERLGKGCGKARKTTALGGSGNVGRPHPSHKTISDLEKEPRFDEGGASFEFGASVSSNCRAWSSQARSIGTKFGFGDDLVHQIVTGSHPVCTVLRMQILKTASDHPLPVVLSAPKIQ